MKKQLLLFTLFLAYVSTSFAQVEDVNVILTPSAGYNWFDAKSTVKDGAMYGFEAGFGFGPIFELRGIYRQSADLNQAFGAYQDDVSDFLNDDNFSFASRDVKVTRIGGELKANIGRGDFSPFLFLGTGVQTFKWEVPNEGTYKNQNLYTSLGVGLKINLSQRITFDLSGKAIVYNMDPSSLFYDPAGSSNLNDWIDNQEGTTMVNWAVSAGLSFYLGGTNTQGLSPLERAYMKRFSGGLSGVRFTLAPMGAYVNFNSESGFRDAYLLGGALGVEFSDYVGLQAYYLQSTKGEDPSFDFDEMAMYGLDFVGRLNIPRGIVPYITIGGGYLNVQEGYQGETVGTPPFQYYQAVSSGYYAKGGLGIEVPLASFVSLYGSANLLYTIGDEETDVADISSADQLQQHTMYNVGLRFKIGKRAHTEEMTTQAFERRFSGERIAYEQQIDSLKEDLKEAYRENDTEKIAEIIKEKQALETEQMYGGKWIALREAKRDSLEQELLEAFENNNTEKALTIMKQKQQIESEIDSLKKQAQIKREPMVRMTPAELQELINQTLDRVTMKEDSATGIERRLDRIEQMILDLKEQKEVKQDSTTLGRKSLGLNKAAATEQSNQQVNETGEEEEIEALQDRVNQLNRRLKEQHEQINQLKGLKEAYEQAAEAPSHEIIVDVPDNNVAANTLYNGDKVSSLKRGFGIFAGYSVGEATSFNFGVRGYYGINRTSIIFMPEVFVALEDKIGFGLGANAVIPVNIKSIPRLKPYGGAGLGINSINGNFSLNPNFIVGTAYQVGNSGNLFFDFTVRGAFKYNQFAIGYKLNF